MNILYISDAYLDLSVYMGQVHTLCNYHSQLNNVKVIVLASYRDIKFKKPHDAKYELIKVFRYPKMFIPIVSQLRAITISKDIIQELKRADVIHCRGHVGSAWAIYLLERFKLSKPVIADIRGVIVEEIKNKKSKLANFYAKKAEKIENIIFQNVNYLFFVSQKMQNYYKKKYNFHQTSVVFPTIVDEKYFYPSSSLKSKMKMNLNIENRITYIYVGGIDYWQNIDKILLRFSKIDKSDSSNYFFIILTNQKRWVIDFCQTHQIKLDNFYIDTIPYKEVGKYLNCADYGVIIREKNKINLVASPTKINEYLACGLKIIDNLEQIGLNNKFFHSKYVNLKSIVKRQYKIYSLLVKKIHQDFAKNNDWSKKLRSIYKITIDPLKILLLTLRADHGGGPQHLNLLINHLSSDFELFVGCPTDEPYYSLWISKLKPTRVFELPHRKFKFSKLLELSQFIRQNEIPLIHSHGKGAGGYSRLLKILNPRLKVIHTLHGFHIGEYEFIKKHIYISVEKLLASLSDQFINVSKGEKDICLKHKIFKKTKSVVIYNGIREIPKEKKAKFKLNLKNQFVIATISRFDYQKNMSLTYEIVRSFKKNRDMVFLWIGDGEEKHELQAKAKREKLNIIFSGFITNIPLYLSAADVYLSTSRWEGLPYALIEAQSLGIPVVATNVIGNNEIITNDVNGYLFNEVKKAHRQIFNLKNDKNIYERFSSNARQNFLDQFEIKKTIDKTTKLYRDHLLT